MPRGGVASLLDVFPRAWLERLRTVASKRTQGTGANPRTVRATTCCCWSPARLSQEPPARSRSPGRRRRDRARTGLIRS